MAGDKLRWTREGCLFDPEVDKAAIPLAISHTQRQSLPLQVFALALILNNEDATPSA